MTALTNSRHTTEPATARTSAEMLTRVSGFIPTTGLVLKMALRSPMYSQRPVYFTAGSGYQEVG